MFRLVIGAGNKPLPVLGFHRKSCLFNGIAPGDHLLFKLLPVLGIGQAVFHILPQHMYKNIYKNDGMKRKEHMAVRTTVGWYLWTHQLVEVCGKDAAAFLDHFFTGNISSLAVGREGAIIMGKYSIDSKVKDLFRNEEAKKVMEKYFPGSTTNPQMKLCYGMTYRKVLAFPEVGSTPELLDKINQEFQAIE